MRIKIFDVGHGSAALILGSHGEKFLVDCAWNCDTKFRPSAFIRRNNLAPVDVLFNGNMDHDHLSDFALCRLAGYKCLAYNYSVSSFWLKRCKEESGQLPISMQSFINSMIGRPSTLPPTYSISWTCFWNNYPLFSETNDLSMVTFFEGDGICIVFPGDLSKAGWLELLQNQKFCELLSRVNVYVAAHHGRKDGYCEEVFAKNLCKPEVIIISDGGIQFDTQKVDYSRHAQGVWIDGEPYFSLTTRTYGDITIDSSQAGLSITTAKGLPPQKRSALALALTANRSHPAPLLPIGARGLLAPAMSTPPPTPPIGVRGLLARAMSTPSPAPRASLMSLADLPESPKQGRGLISLADPSPSSAQSSLSFLPPPTPMPAFNLKPLLSSPPSPPPLSTSGPLLSALIEEILHKKRA